MLGLALDTLKDTLIHLAPVLIVAPQAQHQTPLSMERHGLVAAFEEQALPVLRRGAAFASDIYVEGFKTYDFSVVIDGEQIHNACPNRMDAPVVKVNPLEIKRSVLSLDPAEPYSGLGGALKLYRKRPAKAFTAGGYASGTALSQWGGEVGIGVEKNYHGLYLRAAQAQPYHDGEGKTFHDRYGYRPEAQWAYQVADVSFRGQPRRDVAYGANVRYFKDVLFPYLMMDERFNIDVQAYGEWRKHHIYGHVIHHVMDNRLRKMAAMMEMETDAWVYTAGAHGPVLKKWPLRYELQWKRWKAINTMKMTMPMPMEMKQDLMPDVHTASARLAYEKKMRHHVQVRLRGGLSAVFMGNEQRLPLLQQGDHPAPAYRLFAPVALTVAWQPRAWFAALTLAQEAVTDEYLYITLKRPGNKPNWLGNPYLKAPQRASLRLGWQQPAFISIQTYVHYVRNYVYLAKRMDGNKPIMTYTNISAVLAGASLSLRYKEWVRATVRYTYGENLSEHRPLAEIAPLRAVLSVYSPQWKGWQAYVRTVYNAAQTRIDPQLNEQPTPAWYRLDAGVQYIRSKWSARIEMENLTDRAYYRHLSYLRNPFASGMKVYEPGRLLRLTIRYGL